MMKKLVALMMATLMVMGLIGCGKGEDKDKEVVANNGGKPVQIAYWNSGMGTAYLDKMVEEFNKMQSDWFVYYDASADNDSIKTTYGLEGADTIDLYMSTKLYDTSHMEPLDDVLEATADGDSKKIGDKFDEAYLEYEKATDGHYYTLAWGGGALGVVYNARLFEKAGIEELPRTTNELAVACDKLLEAGITPITHYRGEERSTSGYWPFMQELWHAQYDGWDYYMNSFYGCTDAQGNSPSKDVLTNKDGRYQVLKAMEKFITPEYIQSGANAQDHISAQTMFLNTDIGMMVSGSWMANEMKGTGSAEDFGVMKTPVISGIVDKLTTVKSDTELRNLISAIDEVTDGKADISTYQSGDGYQVNGKTVSAADWDYVKTARNMVATNYPQMSCFIPKYSDAIEGAKEFLKFYYSDEGYKIFTETLHVSLPLSFCEGEVSTEGWSQFELDMDNMFTKAEYTINNCPMTKHDIFVNGGASAYAYYSFVEYFSANNPSDRVNADQAWEEMLKLINANWEQWAANIK